MTPVMEVLDGRCTSTPNGASSPVVDPSLPHLDLEGLSPSKGCVSRECSPERVSPDPSSPRPPQGSNTIQNEEDGEEVAPPREPSPEFQNPISDDPLQEASGQLNECDQKEGSPTFAEANGNLHLNPSLSPREEGPALEEEGIGNNEEQKIKEEELEESPTNYRINSMHPSMLCRNEEEEELPQMEPNNYSLNSLEGRNTPSREDEIPYPEDQESTDPELSEHPHHGIDATSSIGEQSQQFSESGSHLSSDDLRHQQSLLDDHHRHSLQETHNHLEEHQVHLQNSHHQQYNDQQCHMQDEYQYSMIKVPSHLQDHMRDQQLHIHDYNEHQHSLGDQRHHLQDPLGDHLHLHHHLPPERSHGYWNMHLGMLSKVKSETKEWYEREGMVPDGLGNTGLLKSPDQHDLYNSYRIPSHPSLGSESPRPSPIPHGSLPFSQSPDLRQHQQPQHQQHYQAYQNHTGMRDMSPMSPKYQDHPRGHLQPSQHHGASQLPGAQHHGVQLPSLQHPSQHHPGHLQQPYGPQYGGQQLGLQGHPGQQLASPYAQGLMAGIGGPVGHRIHDGREGREGDPYSFVDEYTGPPPRPVDEILGHAQPKRRGRKPKHVKLMENGGDPLAIAAAQAAHEAKKRKWRQMGPDGKPLPLPVKPRKRIDRFDGISEDELSKKILPDHLGPNLDIVIIGINPGLFAAYKGHHYAGPGNHFWKCLYLSGLIPEPLTSDDDHQLLDHGIGFTNIVSRTTRGSSELTRKEIKEGGQILLAKLQRYQPRVAVFNGKGIYEIFSGKKEFSFGRQPEKIEGTHTHVWVMPSSSARCAQLPRALDKVPFYTALRKFRDFLKGTITELTEEEVTFTCPKTMRHLKDCEKLDGVLEDDLSDPFLDDSLKDDLDSSRFESDLDSEEISRSISQSLYNLSGMTREQLEALDCPTIPIRKKRGRPKKAPEDPNAPPRPKPRSFPTELLMCNGEEPPRKKRGRPKKVLEDGSIATPKRPGRKPKALKEMLATQQGQLGGPGMHPNHHAQMGIGHLNGMMSPSGYNTNPNGPPFSPQFGGPQVHPLNGPTHPGDLMSSVHGVGTPNPHGMGGHPGLSGSHNPMHGGHGPMIPGPGMASLQHPQGCPTPNSSSGAHTPVHNSMPPRGHTPQGFGQSPGYSPSPVPSHLHHLNSVYSHHAEKSSEMQLEEERQLGISPIPASPGMAQPDFEPPARLPEGDPIINEGRSISSHQEEPNPSIPSQFSNPGTPADENPPSYQAYSNYPPPSCSPKYNSNITPSPSYPPSGVSQSPSFPPSVSCSPSYTPHNTHSPSYPPNSTQSPSYHHTIAQSPSYPPNTTQSPSYPRNTTQSPSYPPNPSRSPSYHAQPNQSPSFPPVTQSPSYPSNTSQSPSYPPNISQSPSYPPNISQSPTYSTLTASPSYPTNLTQSPSYATNSTQSPLYQPPTSQSPSFHAAPTLSPSLNKPIAPGVHSPQMKSDVSSKSLSGLESLVDQIPSLNEGENGPLTNGPCSNPTTPGPPNDPFSPGHGPQNSSFQSYSGPGSTFPATHYGSPQPSTNPYSPQFTSSSTNLSTNFSVSSLASSSSSSLSSNCDTVTTTSSNTAVSSTSTSTFSVSSLTGSGSPTPTPSMYNNSYSPAPPGPSPHSYDVMGSSILPPTPPMGPSFMGSNSMGSPMGGLPTSMNMSGSQLPYHYPQYGDSGPGGYAGPGHTSFPYGSSSGFHVPSPRFPYPSPYSGGPYSQGYSQNAMLERIKQTGMGFGSF